MPTRVTNSSLNATVLANNQRTLSRIATYQEQLATQKRVNRVSDDPVAAKTALRYRTERYAGEKYLDNIGKAGAFMEATDSALAEMTSAMEAVKSLAVQGANGTQDAASRRALAKSVDSYLTRMVDLGNTVHDGRYLFSGTTVQTQPFRRTGDEVAYHGNLDTFSVAVGAAATITVNENGYSLFKGSTDVFATLRDLKQALEANDAQRITAQITKLDGAHDYLNNLHGAMGGRMQRLELTRSQLEGANVFLGQLVSEAEDVDITEAISQLQQNQVALEAGLQAGARVLQPSLLDFLR
jgi:flagellar hook-associated protein 3 FlgL